MNPEQLLNLPWQLQLSLASGYAAYALAYSGIRAHHKPLDVTFLTLIFGLFAYLALALLPDSSPIVAVTAAFIVPIIAAFVWRRWLRGLWSALMRRVDLSWSNDDPSALETLCANSKHRLSQIAILLDDGTWLRCEDTTKFAKAPFGPCQIGSSGDVALYVTHEDAPDGTTKEQTTVQSEHYGARLTYVPASRVKRINLRHVSRAKSSVVS